MYTIYNILPKIYSNRYHVILKMYLLNIIFKLKYFSSNFEYNLKVPTAFVLSLKCKIIVLI